MPTCCPVSGNGEGSAHSHEKLTYHLPVLLRRIVAVLGVPSSGRCKMTFTCADHNTQPLSIRVQFAADWHLREGEAVIAPLAAKARITRRLHLRTRRKNA